MRCTPLAFIRPASSRPGAGRLPQRLARVLLAGVLLAGATAAQAAQYVVVDLGDGRNGMTVLVTGMNRHGVVVGVGTGRNLLMHPMKFMPNGHLVDVAERDGVPGMRGVLRAINDHGTSLGWLSDESGLSAMAFTEQHGQITPITTPSGDIPDALAINDSGDVVGSIITKADGCPGTCAFLLHQGQWTVLPTLPKATDTFARAINRHGVIVGETMQYTRQGGISKAVRWVDGRIHAVPGMAQLSGNAVGVNDLGEIAGAYRSPAGNWTHAFRWRDGVLTDLDDREDGNSVATAINSAGQVIGQRYLPERHGPFVTVDGTMRWLQDLLLTGPDGPWQILEANGLNDAGQIAGIATNARGRRHAVRLDPAPP